MDKEYLTELMRQVASGEKQPEDAVEILKELPFEDLGFANVDHHRSLRTGYPEAVFCQGKKPQQIAAIMKELAVRNKNVIGTRASQEDFEAVRAVLPAAGYFDEARMIVLMRDPLPHMDGTIAVVTAGTADIPVAEEAAITAQALGNKVDRIYDVGVAGIHRLFAKLDKIRRASVVIVVAGMEGALASVVGGLVERPVIAVPTSIGYGANLGGISALLSMLNSCANGVGIVNIDNGFGAAYLASNINRMADGGKTREKKMKKKLYFDCGSGVSSDMILKALTELGGNGKGAEQLQLSGDGHSHSHKSHREIQELIKNSPLPQKVKETMLSVYGAIAAGEAKVHGSTVEDVHFHEVGRDEAIRNIAGIAASLESLGIDEIYCSEIHDGKGFIQCSHGRIPVPVPAVMAMRETCDYVFVSDEVDTEMVTPSGLGILIGIKARYAETIPQGKIVRTAVAKGARNTGKEGLKALLIEGN